MSTQTDQAIIDRARTWLHPSYDAETRAQVEALIEAGGEPLADAFYKDLAFGTGGLRGVMGVGTNRINIYTVAKATQGLCNYLKKAFANESISVAIACDSRNNSDLFSRTTAEVCSANGIEVHVFESLRPTPELSFALRTLGCKAGVVITASHNPPEYNGYKVYFDDGAQLVPPHDRNVINEVNAISGNDMISFEAKPELIHTLGAEMDAKYLDAVCSLSLTQNKAAVHGGLRVVYTPIHGTGINGVPQALAKLQYTDVHVVEAQATPDGNFPTVKSPNPEETAALALGIELATSVNGDVVLGTDPDSDRVGIVARDFDGKLTILNGNQAGALLVWYMLSQRKAQGKLSSSDFVAKTVVTTELIKGIADAFGVDCADTLTGFKYIAEQIRLREGKQYFVAGGEESYGYLAGDFVRDKDAIISSVLLCEIAAWAKAQGKTLFHLLADIYTQFGFYKERLISITRKGRTGAQEIEDMMAGYRTNAPAELAGAAVVEVIDHKAQTRTNTTTGETAPTGLPASNVIQFLLADGGKVTARPSGTEPKIKFYFSVNAPLANAASYAATEQQLEARIDALVAALKLA